MKTTITVLAVLLAQTIFGQMGVSSGSLSMVQNNGLHSFNESGRLNQRMIIVEDFMNYHKHQISVPHEKEVALSIDYDNTILDNDEFILQVGLATQTKENLTKSDKNVNISLVVDRSSSMNGNQKMRKVKEALKVFVGELDNDSYLSIITFDHNANVVLSSVLLGKNRENIYKIIDNIHTGGSTNINDGMMLGYQEVMKKHSDKVNSRVILLTDGMTNSGETNPEKIVQNSKTYTDKGIEISTIGVGQSLDFDLLKTLAETGKGSNHFIGDNETDIQKVFVDELESLLYQIGKNPEITIELPKGFSWVKNYGYEPSFDLENNKITIATENLNSGITQIFLLKVKRETDKTLEVKAKVTFDKNKKSETVIATQKTPSKGASNDEIRKNFSIAYMADALKEYANDYVNNNSTATKSINEVLGFAQKTTNTKDEDVKRVYDILDKLITPKNSYTPLN